AGEDVIADANLYRRKTGADPLIKSFIMAGDEDQPLFYGKFACHLLIKLSALRREQDSRRRPAIELFQVLDGIKDDRAHHHHARAAAEWLVIHRFMRIGGEVAEVG